MINELIWWNGEMVNKLIWWNNEMVNKLMRWNGEMTKWWTLCNGDMVKCQNTMVFFSYVKLVLYHPFLNVLSGSEVVYPHHFMLHLGLYLPLNICVPLSLPVHLNLYLCPHLPLSIHHFILLYLSPPFYPNPLPLLHLQFCPHIRLKFHPPICLPISSWPHHYLPLRLPLPCPLHPPLHIHLTIHLRPIPIPIPILFLFLFLPHRLHVPINFTYIFFTITCIQAKQFNGLLLWRRFSTSLCCEIVE